MNPIRSVILPIPGAFRFLARLRFVRAAVALAVGVSLLSCDQVLPSSLSSENWDLVVEPREIDLPPGASTELSALLIDGEGTTRQPSAVGHSVEWSSEDPEVVSVNAEGMLRSHSTGSVEVHASVLDLEAASSVTVNGSSELADEPGTVDDLAVVSTTDTSATLAWTQVEDGVGNAANYAVRYGSPSITWWEAHGTERTVSGDSIGSQRTYEYVGLSGGTEYEFRVVAFRGTLNEDAVFGEYSNKAAATTTATQDKDSVAEVIVSTASLTFTTTGDTAQLSAIALDSGGDTLSDVTLDWESTDMNVATVDSMGMVASKGFGTALVIVSAVCCSAADTTDVHVGEDELPEGVPEPNSADVVVLDTRAGGDDDIQGASTLDEALHAAGLKIQEHCSSGNCYGPGWSSDIDGEGKRGFIWNVVEDAGNPDGCVAGGDSQHKWMLYTGIGATGEIWVQYRFWSGQTSSGGGVAGNIGEFSHTGQAGGHKDLVFFRAGEGNDGRLTVVSQSGTSHSGQNVKVNDGDGYTGTYEVEGNESGHVWPDVEWDKSDSDKINREVVQTVQIQPASADGQADGALRIWMDDVLVNEVTDADIGAAGWSELQIGGPTWICPPMDQTLYLYDIVVWQPE